MLGYEIYEIYTIKGEKKIKEPLAKAQIKVGKTTLNSIADQTLISRRLYNLADEGLIIETDKRKFKVQFDPLKFRPSDVPVLLSNIEKIKGLGFRHKKELTDIAKDQINYYLDPDHRNDLTVE